MTLGILAFVAGILVGLSRQLNGRLALGTSPLKASFWNHLIGFGLLAGLAVVFGGLLRDGTTPPLWAYLGGPLGVVFVASSSWLVARIGAVQTATLMIAGQMIFGLGLDLAMGVAGDTFARGAGIGLVLGGLALTLQSPRR